MSFRLFLFCTTAFAASVAAQTGAPFSSQNNALGGQFGAPAMGRPLGGIQPARGSGPERGDRHAGPRATEIYGTSWYVPGYFDFTNGYGYGTASSVAVYNANSMPVVMPVQPVAAPAATPAPVIINQYFNGLPAAPASAAPLAETPKTAGEPLAPVENYYLIAYKDHSVFSAISYWLEDKTLHYVTTKNAHNQASLDLIDLERTKSLNQARDVPFALPRR